VVRINIIILKIAAALILTAIMLITIPLSIVWNIFLIGRMLFIDIKRRTRFGVKIAKKEAHK
jgi:hypothetical protein